MSSTESRQAQPDRRAMFQLETELDARNAEVERLADLNDRLSKQIIGASERLEASRRELLAIGWDAAVTEADRRWTIGATSAGLLKADNPYRKPALDFGGVA